MFAPTVSGSSSFDLQVDVALATTTDTLSLSILFAPAQQLCAGCQHSAPLPQLTVAITVGAVGSDELRPATLCVTPGMPVNASFTLPSTETALSVRVLADRTIAETFVGGGRAVVTSPLATPTAVTAVVRNTGAASLKVDSIGGWELGCGWASYPN